MDTIQFTPQLVVNFCNDFKGVNPIHNDPEAAQKQGYKEPIWGGTQGMHICMGYLRKLLREKRLSPLFLILKRPHTQTHTHTQKEAGGRGVGGLS